MERWKCWGWRVLPTGEGDGAAAQGLQEMPGGLPALAPWYPAGAEAVGARRAPGPENQPVDTFWDEGAGAQWLFPALGAAWGS